MVLTLYPVYGWIRDLVGVSRAGAFRNAKQIIDWQERLGIYHERTIQGGSSIAVVHRVLEPLLRRRSLPRRRSRWWRCTTSIRSLRALAQHVPVDARGRIGRVLVLPLMPPRLLPSTFGFVDTRLTYTIGKPVPHSQETGNLYSAMPSLHIAWATWAVFALWPLVRGTGQACCWRRTPC